MKGGECGQIHLPEGQNSNVGEGETELFNSPVPGVVDKTRERQTRSIAASNSR